MQLRQSIRPQYLKHMNNCETGRAENPNQHEPRCCRNQAANWLHHALDTELFSEI